MSNSSAIIPISRTNATDPLVLVALKIASLCARPASVHVVDEKISITEKRLFLMAATPSGAFFEASAHALDTGTDGIIVRRGSRRRQGQLEFDAVLTEAGRTEWMSDLRLGFDRFDGTWFIPIRRSGHAIWVGRSGLVPSTAVWEPRELAAAFDRVPDLLWQS